MQNLIIAVIVGIIVSFLLIDWEKPVDTEKTQLATSWLKNHYKNFPIGSDWTVTNINSDSEIIKISVTVPNTTAASLINLNIRRQRTILSTVCPNKYEKIWKIIDKNHVIEAEFTAIGAGVFSVIYCNVN